MRFLEKLQPLALLVLRVAVGLSFVAHGYPKLNHVLDNLPHGFVVGAAADLNQIG